MISRVDSQVTSLFMLEIYATSNVTKEKISHLKYQMPLTKPLNVFSGLFLEDFNINNLILIHVTL